MPQLLKQVVGEIINNRIGSVKLLTSVTGQVQREDYINLNGFFACLQNLSRTELTSGLIAPIEFGLKNNYNVEIAMLEISY